MSTLLYTSAIPEHSFQHLKRQVLVPYMGGITFLDYVKELPKGKREAKGATKGGYATTPQKKPAAAKAAPAAALESSARGLAAGVEETKGGGGSGDSEADAIADKITSKVGTLLYVRACTYVCSMYVIVRLLICMNVYLLIYICT